MFSFLVRIPSHSHTEVRSPRPFTKQKLQVIPGKLFIHYVCCCYFPLLEKTERDVSCLTESAHHSSVESQRYCCKTNAAKLFSKYLTNPSVMAACLALLMAITSKTKADRGMMYDVHGTAASTATARFHNCKYE